MRGAARPGSVKPSTRVPSALEDLDAFSAPGRVGHDESAIRREVKGACAQNASRFRPDLDDLRGFARPANKVNAVCPTIEDVVVAGCGLLKGFRFAEFPDDECGETAGRAELFDATGAL